MHALARVLSILNASFNGLWAITVLSSPAQIALEAIYSSPGAPEEEENFKKDADGKGFTLRVVPHPGDAEANFVWADLSIRCWHALPQSPLRPFCGAE